MVKPKKTKSVFKSVLIVALAAVLAFAGLVVWVNLHTNIPSEKGEPSAVEKV